MRAEEQKAGTLQHGAWADVRYLGCRLNRRLGNSTDVTRAIAAAKERMVFQCKVVGSLLSGMEARVLR